MKNFHALVRSGLCIAAASLTTLALNCASLAQDDCTKGGLPPTYLARLDSGRVAAPSAGGVVTIRFDNVPLEADSLRYRFEASADLGLASELFYCRVNGGDWRQVYFDSERDCANPPNCTNWGISNFYWVVGDSIVVEIAASPGVTAATCPQAFIRLVVQYTAFMDDDCNGNRRNDCPRPFERLNSCQG